MMQRRARQVLWLAVASLSLPLVAQAQTQTWDNGFDGIDSAADDVPNWLRWDSAIDDDWDLPNDSFQLNTPSPGFMTVDRVGNPADAGKTGNIWVRDPILNYADGFTMEVTVKLMPDSETNAFSMTYLDQGGSFGVQLSPDSIKVGGLDQNSAGTTVAFNTTNDFHTYWMEQLPNSHTVKLFVDGTLVATGQGTTDYAAGSTVYLPYPRVLIGDNSNATNINADYVLDNVEYRRGASTPTQTQPVFPARTLPAPPAPAVNETWSNGYYASTGIPSNTGWEVDGGSNYTPQADGSIRVQGDTNARLDGVPGWTNMTPVTVEASIKVMPDSQENGFQLVVNDTYGDMALVLSPDKVTFEEAYSFVGQASVDMNTTDAFHTYRITRDTDGLYWDLFIDNNPVAAIADQHSGGEQISFSRIWFGDINFPDPGNTPDVEINYIQWHQGANAPNAPQLVNLTWNSTGGSGNGTSWDVGANQNWNSGVQASTYTQGNNVIFNDNNNSHYSVNLMATVSPSSITINNSSGSYAFSGSGSIAGTGSLTKSGTGTATLSTLNTYTGGTKVTAGTLVIATNGALPASSSVAITGGKLQLAPSTGLTQISSLTVSGTGQLDITNNHIIINYGSGADPVQSIAAALKSGFHGGLWNGSGINSSTAAANPGYGVGYADSADPGNPAGLASGTIEIKFTLLGDADLNGIVNGIDFGIVAANFNKGVTGWDQGDFDYNNIVNGTDFGYMAANFNFGAAGASTVAAIDAFAAANGLMADVPEPGSLMCLAGAAVGVMTRRRRSS